MQCVGTMEPVGIGLGMLMRVVGELEIGRVDDSSGLRLEVSCPVGLFKMGISQNAREMNLMYLL